MLSINWDFFVAKLCSRLLHDVIQLLINEEVATPTTLNSISSSTRISLEEKIEFLLEAVFLDHLKLLVVFFCPKPRLRRGESSRQSASYSIAFEFQKYIRFQD